MLSLEDQIKRYGDFLEGEALRGVELDVDAVEFQRGRSWFVIAAAVALVAGLGVFVAFGLNSGSSSEVVAVGEDEATTTREQMWLDHSDGIAIEVVGDELWILGNGFGSPGAQAPFSIYVTGPEGELLRTIDLGRHFDQMGQSESYVWLVVDGTTQEKPDREPEVMRISKETGEIERASWENSRGSLLAAVFSDDGLWFSAEGSETLWRFSFEEKVVTELPSSRAGSGELEVSQDALVTVSGTGWLYRVALDGSILKSVRLPNDDSPVVDLLADEDLLWVLQENGMVLLVTGDLATSVEGRCVGANHLAAISYGKVLAVHDFEACVLERELERRSAGYANRGQADVVDSVVFAGQLWSATWYVADRISTPLTEVGGNLISTRERMRADKSNGVALEVVGDELWILGGGSEDSGADGPYAIYVTGVSGKLLRTIFLDRRFDQMTQSRSYVWLSLRTMDENLRTASTIVRVSKATNEVEVFFASAKPGGSLVFDDEGAWSAASHSYADGSMFHLLLSWETSDPSGLRSVELSGIPNDTEITHIAKGSGSIYVGTSAGWVYRVSSDGQMSDGVQLTVDSSPVLDLIADEGRNWVLQENGIVSFVRLGIEAIPMGICQGATELRTTVGGVIALNGLESCLLGPGLSDSVRVIPSPWEVADTALVSDHVWYATYYDADSISFPLEYEAGFE